MNLTEKQKIFADYYIETLNATESYIRAYEVKNRKTAEVNASRLLSKAKVKAYIDERLSQKEEKRIASQDEILELLTKIARGDETEEQIVTEFVKVGKQSTRKIDKKLSAKDRLKAIELLGKRYELLDGVKVTVNNVLEVDALIQSLMDEAKAMDD